MIIGDASEGLLETASPEGGQVQGPRALPLAPGILDHLHIFRIRLFGAYLHEAAPHLLHHELIPKNLHGVQFSVVPGTLQELQHQHTHALAHRAQGCSHGCCCLALARTRIYDDKTSAYVRHGWRFDSTRSADWLRASHSVLNRIATFFRTRLIFHRTPASNGAYPDVSRSLSLSRLRRSLS